MYSVLAAFLALGSCLAHAGPSLSRVPDAKNPSSGDSIHSRFRISDVEIRGNKKIEKDAIEAKMKLRVGVEADPELLRSDIQSLFRTGFFFDVQMLRQGTKLVVEVIEKPSLLEIRFEGASDLKSEDLLETSGLKLYEVLNLAKLKEARERIQKSYEDKGFYLARVDTEVLEDNSKEGGGARVLFKIEENEKVRIGRISFIGNKKLTETELKERLTLQERGFFSFASSSGQFKPEALEVDTRILRSVYLNAGFVKAVVNRPYVSVTPDRRTIYITYTIEEGDAYEVGEVEFSGDLLYSREELSELLQINKRRMFSYDVLLRDLAELSAKYGDLGYAFTNVIPKTNARVQEKKLDIVFDFDKGQKVYIGNVTIVGNKSTRDKVLRRELKIREGELYHETRKRQSLERIQRLGFFEEVNFKQITSPERPDVMDLEIVVRERSTGTLQVSAGYGNVQGFNLGGSVSQTNFRGLGQNLGAGLNISRDVSDYCINFTEPA
ncbi:MAG: outer membrane protein assembly factor BamA, partial [Bdellovibrio sp.]